MSLNVSVCMERYKEIFFFFFNIYFRCMYYQHVQYLHAFLYIMVVLALYYYYFKYLQSVVRYIHMIRCDYIIPISHIYVNILFFIICTCVHEAFELVWLGEYIVYAYTYIYVSNKRCLRCYMDMTRWWHQGNKLG